MEPDALYDVLAEGSGWLTREGLLAIDLTAYDRLRTYPTQDGNNWQLERDKILFLQTAVRAGIPWSKVANGTFPHFGPSLRPPFEPVCEPLAPCPYQPPVYDQSRHTPAEWAREADTGWQKHRDELLKPIQVEYDELVASGRLGVFDRARVTRDSAKNAPIVEEVTAYEMAAKHFFLQTKWTDLAVQYPPSGGWHRNPNQKAIQKRKRANQIRMRVQDILSHLRLLVGKRK